MEQEERIELRSEKVRNVIRQKPPFFVRWDTLLVAIILLLLYYIYKSRSFRYLLSFAPTLGLVYADSPFLLFR